MQIKGIPSDRGTNKSAVEKPRIRFERLFVSPPSSGPLAPLNFLSEIRLSTQEERERRQLVQHN